MKTLKTYMKVAEMIVIIALIIRLASFLISTLIFGFHWSPVTDLEYLVHAVTGIAMYAGAGLAGVVCILYVQEKLNEES